MKKKRFPWLHAGCIALAGALCAAVIPAIWTGDAGSLTGEINGGYHETQMRNMSEKIVSHELISFSYEAQEELRAFDEEKLSAKAFSVSCEVAADGMVRVRSSGGDADIRDGSRFLLDFEAPEDGLLMELDDVVRRYELAHDNGRLIHVDGLPPFGDTLRVNYASGEEIYRASNQSRCLDINASEAIYEAFLAFARKNGFDFTTAGSNQVIYDDADVDYLQGTWEGSHFGRNVKAVFMEQHVQIWVEGELTDDTDYVVVEGAVLPERRIALDHEPYQPEDGYEHFHALALFRKSSSFTLTGYVYEPAYSTFSLRKLGK